jgi:hypothetical protein
VYYQTAQITSPTYQLYSISSQAPSGSFCTSRPWLGPSQAKANLVGLAWRYGKPMPDKAKPKPVAFRPSQARTPLTWILTHTNKEKVGQPRRCQGLKARKNHVILASLTASTYGASDVVFPIISAAVMCIMQYCFKGAVKLGCLLEFWVAIKRDVVGCISAQSGDESFSSTLQVFD